MATVQISYSGMQLHDTVSLNRRLGFTVGASTLRRVESHTRGVADGVSCFIAQRPDIWEHNQDFVNELYPSIAMYRTWVLLYLIPITIAEKNVKLQSTNQL